ncbi:hypothetical protein EMMF5_001797 [Cystobasidiomycetes sp. EMM_F5]
MSGSGLRDLALFWTYQTVEAALEKRNEADLCFKEWDQDQTGHKVFGISLADIYMGYGLEVDKNDSNLTLPSFKPWDPVWQTSQQFRFHCQPNDQVANSKLDCWEAQAGRYGKNCLFEPYGNQGNCLTIGSNNILSWSSCGWDWKTTGQLWDILNVAGDFKDAHIFPGTGAASENGVMARPA